jgi:hypothetical protein
MNELRKRPAVGRLPLPPTPDTIKHILRQSSDLHQQIPTISQCLSPGSNHCDKIPHIYQLTIIQIVFEGLALKL